MQNLVEASKELYQELSSKNFPRDRHEAYLSCFLNIGSIDKFLTALEENAAQQSVQPTVLCAGHSEGSFIKDGVCQTCGLPAPHSG